MIEKYYHIYSDGKRVKEITQDEFRSWNKKYPGRQVLSIQNGFIAIAQYDTIKYLPLAQLVTALKMAGVTFEE